jgi:hypothetical protein
LSKAIKRTIIQVDVDGIWTCRACYGTESPLHPDIIYSEGIPNILKLFRKYGVSATFFIVGKDTLIPEKREAILRIRDEGHEIANHSFSHLFGFSKLDSSAKEDEIARAEEALSDITGEMVYGFRAPGYDVSEDILKILGKRGYIYDSSVLPTFAGPVIRRISRAKLKDVLGADELKTRSNHYGKLSYGLAPMRPYRPSFKKIWHEESEDNDNKVWELPISTSRFFRMPIHSSFILALCQINYKLGMSIMRWEMKVRGTYMNYLFHPLEFVDIRDHKDLKVQNGAGLPFSRKIYICEEILDRLSSGSRPVSTIEFLRSEGIAA